MSQTESLYNLQTLDSQIDTVHKRLSEIADLLNQNAEVRAAQAALAEIERIQAEWLVRQTGLEHERDHLQQEAKSTEERLYSGLVFNPRELGDLQDKLAELNHRRDGLEEPQFQAMLALENGASSVRDLTAELERVLSEQTRASGKLSKEQADLTMQLHDLESQAALARDQVGTPNLALYDKLRRKANGVAVTLIRGTGCGVCGVELTTQIVQEVRHDSIITCPTCGRILYI